MRITTILIVLLFVSFTHLSGQEQAFQTFKDTRVVSSHSVETLKANRLDFRIAHRFGDFAGAGGGWQTFYGLENAADVLIGFEYGVTDKFMVGINRTKGGGPLPQNINGMMKFRLIKQEYEGSQPFSLAFVGLASMSTAQRTENNPAALTFFEEFAHRLSYHAEVIIGRKFSERISFQLSGGWTYRNIVSFDDRNDLAHIGGAGKFQLNRALALLFDVKYPISSLRTSENGFYVPLGFALEWETGGGHVFQINFVNSRGLSETDFIPYTRSKWADGEYRIGFTVSRLFTL